MVHLLPVLGAGTKRLGRSPNCAIVPSGGVPTQFRSRDENIQIQKLHCIHAGLEPDSYGLKALGKSLTALFCWQGVKIYSIVMKAYPELMDISSSNFKYMLDEQEVSKP